MKADEADLILLGRSPAPMRFQNRVVLRTSLRKHTTENCLAESTNFTNGELFLNFRCLPVHNFA